MVTACIRHETWPELAKEAVERNVGTRIGTNQSREAGLAFLRYRPKLRREE
jgi:hypothetical protein